MKAKVCNECGKVKPLTEFHFHTEGLDHRRSQCKTCTNKKHRQRKIHELPYLHPILHSFLRHP